jgi:alpha-mannosidase
VPALASRFRQPPLAFVVEPAAGPLGRSWSFFAADGDAELAALKEHEDGGEWVVRLLDPLGHGGTTRLRLPSAVLAARDLDGCEDAVERPAASVNTGHDVDERLAASSPTGDGGAYEVALEPHRPRTIGLRLAPPARQLTPPHAEPLRLPCDRVVVTAQGQPCPHGIGPRRVALPAELFPASLEVGGIPFVLGRGGTDCQALSCTGQSLALPAGTWDRLWLLLASAGAGGPVTVTAGALATEIDAPPALLPLARPDQVPRLGLGPVALWALRPGYRRDAAVAWTAGHCHDRDGRDLPYHPVCLFAASLPLPAGAREVALPAEPEILVFAATVAAGGGTATASWAGASAVDRLGKGNDPAGAKRS